MTAEVTTKKGLFELIEDRLLVFEMGHATMETTFADIVLEVKRYLDSKERERTTTP